MLEALHKRILSHSIAVLYIPVGKIDPNPAQPRKTFDPSELRSLAHSISENGVIQPITVRENGERFTLVAGERRLRASIMAGLREIPAIISDIGERESSLVALLENLQRSDLDFFEEARGIYNLLRTYGFSQEEAAKRLGKSQSAISNKLRLLKLNQTLADKITEHSLSERHARALLRLDSLELQENTLNLIVEKGWNVSQTDEYVEKLLISQDTPKPIKQRARIILRDMRPFVNTVNRAVDTLRTSGIKADITKSEDEHAFYMTISVFKNSECST